jgi:hypothetical protein
VTVILLIVGHRQASGSPGRWSLFGYFDQHFRLLKFASGFRGKGDVPRGGLYERG